MNSLLESVLSQTDKIKELKYDNGVTTVIFNDDTQLTLKDIPRKIMEKVIKENKDQTHAFRKRL